MRWFKGESDPEDKADWVEPGEVGGHDHVGTSTTTEIEGLDTGSAYRVQVRAKNHEGAGPWSDSGGGTPTGPPTVIAVGLVSVPTADVDGDNVPETYRSGDRVRARVTFSAAVDVVGGPVLKLRFDGGSDEKPMTFDASQGRTRTSTIDFTYSVAAGDLSRDGIAFYANGLLVDEGSAIRLAGTTVEANLAFAKVDHNAFHKVDGVAPRLIATNPVSVTSSAGDDDTYAIGDAIRITARFDDAVTVTTAQTGAAVVGPRIPFTLGPATRHAAYAAGSGTRALVFRYTVAAGDADTDGIEIAANALALKGGVIADGAGNAATLTHTAVAASASHAVDGVRPTLARASVDGTTLTLTFSEDLGAAANLANGAFTVKKTPAQGAERTVNLSAGAPPAISGRTVTLTLAAAVVASDFGVKVSYAKPPTGTDNTIRDVAGNDAASFPDQLIATNEAPGFPPSALAALAVAENSAPGTLVGTVAAADPDDDALTYALSSDGNDHEPFDIDGEGRITVAPGATLDHETKRSYAITVEVRDGRDTSGSPDPDTTPDATHRLTVAVTDVDEPPGQLAAAPTVTGLSGSKVRVRWTKPDRTGKPAVTGYDVRWFKGSADPDDDSKWNLARPRRDRDPHDPHRAALRQRLPGAGAGEEPRGRRPVVGLGRRPHDGDSAGCAGLADELRGGRWHHGPRHVVQRDLHRDDDHRDRAHRRGRKRTCRLEYLPWEFRRFLGLY